MTRSPGLRSKVSLVLENLARAAEGRTLQGGGEAGLTRVISSRAWAEGARRRKGERVGAGGVRGFAERESKSKERNVYVMVVVRETCVLQRPLRDALWAAPCHCGGWEGHEDTAMSSRFAGQRT